VTAVGSDVAFLSRALKAPRIRAVASTLAERARSESWDYEAYLAAVLSEEVASREVLAITKSAVSRSRKVQSSLRS